ncbi:hypothetical protein ACQPZX_17245 [Actinoplanes sp. CA-142083]|uniref:hypothetical protein n=1 Tax=Actinoplanes sp. CA-142083 TaxID=3239903 RepID=UPI003D8B3879
MRHLRLSDRLLPDALGLHAEPSVLGAELWASGWLGRAWRDAAIGEREPEHQLCLEVAARAVSWRTVDALAAVVALRRVARESEHRLLDEAIELLAESQPLPAWHDTPSFEAVRAWRAVDVWDSERVLFVEFTASGDAEATHTLMAQILTTSGTMISYLDVLRAGAAASWEEAVGPDRPPMPLTEATADDVLAELADALRATDMLWPRPDEDDYIDSRALAWARCAPHLPDWRDFEPLPAAERQSLITAFLAANASTADPAPAGPAPADAAPAGSAPADAASADQVTAHAASAGPAPADAASADQVTAHAASAGSAPADAASADQVTAHAASGDAASGDAASADQVTAHAASGDAAGGDATGGDAASGDGDAAGAGAGGEPGDDVAASLADLFLDYGDGYLHDHPLGWSPMAVALFLTDWLPRKVVLDAGQRAALPETLRRWVRFALGRRGVAERWIEPVVAAVDEYLDEFAEAFDDESGWGPAKAIAAELAGRGVDLDDRAAVDQGVHALNAERLARRLIDPDQ